MARSDSAQILIAIRGGIEAARQATAVAGAMDDVGDNTRQAGRDAAEAAGGFAILSHELDRTKRKMDLMRVSSEGMTVAALGLSAHYLPALAGTLGHVAVSAGIVAAAFGAGAVALGVTLVGMGKAIEARYKATVDTVGSAANRLHKIIGSVSTVGANVTAPGADAALGGLAAGLAPLRGLLKTLKPQITAIGKAMGSAFAGLGRELSKDGPQVRGMLNGVPAAVKALANFAGSALKLFLRLGTSGLPLVVKALQAGARLADDLTRSLTNKKINSSVSDLVGFGKILGKIFTAARGYIRQVLQALKPAQPFLDNVIVPLLIGLGKGLKGLLPGIKVIAEGLGAIGTAAKPLRGVFEDIGQVIAVVFGGDILKAIGEGLKIIPWVGKVGDAFSLLGRGIEGASSLILRVLGRIVGDVEGPFARAFGSLARPVQRAVSVVLNRLGSIVVYMLGLPGKIARAASGMFNSLRSAVSGPVSFVKSKVDSIVSFVKSLPGKIARAAKGMFNGILNAVRGPINTVKGWLNSLLTVVNHVINAANKVTSLPGKLLHLIPGLYTGGVVGHAAMMRVPAYAGGTPSTSAATVLVGEKGPELATLPVGTKITPNDQTQGLLSRPIILHDSQTVDGRVLVRTVRRIEADWRGRS